MLFRRIGLISQLCTLCGALMLWVLAGCSVLMSYPEAPSAAARRRAMPHTDLALSSPVTVHWGPHAIPFLEAETDNDLAYALGLVHAHLRLGQMELLRRIAAGRLAEMAGPSGRELDELLRTIDLDKSVARTEQRLPPQTRRWLSRFVQGINHVVLRAKVPPEFALLGLEREPWTVQDVLRIARLAASDLSWEYYVQEVNKMGHPDAERYRLRVQELADRSIPSFETQTDGLSVLLGSATKSGSNSLAVSGSRTESGIPILANDPHLGQFAPNFWLIIGYRSPSYHVLGLSIPGLPFVAVGRNEHMAWGGTNMRAISSHLFELDETMQGSVTTRTEVLKTRFWFDKTLEIQDSPLGPVVSNLELLSSDTPIALHWVGHQPTDELTPFLQANRADNWRDFVRAFRDYAVGAQNILFADKDGNIGQVMAYRQTVLKDPSKTRQLVKHSSNSPVGYRGPHQLPLAVNPEKGYIASSNNLPAVTEIPIAFGLSTNNRVRRMDQLMASKPRVGLEDIKRWHRDVLSLSSQRIQSEVLRLCGGYLTERSLPKKERLMWQTFKQWDGHYRRSQRGPVAFELLMAHAAPEFLSKEWPDPEFRKTIVAGDYWKPLTEYALKAERDPRFACGVVRRALESGQEAFAEFPNWGKMHSLSFGPPVAEAPIVGSRFHLEDLPLDGTSDTLLKAAHPLVDGATGVTFGACARHISDLSDPNENYFVLLGGQDGWLNSPHLSDQTALWQRGEYIRVPLQLDAVRKWALHRSTLERSRALSPTGAGRARP